MNMRSDLESRSSAKTYAAHARFKGSEASQTYLYESEMKNVAKQKKLHFKRNGIYAYTSHMIGADAFIAVETAVINDTAVAQDLWVDIHMHRLVDTGKYEIAEEPGIKAAGAVKATVPAGGCKIARTKICVENAVLWETNAPTLYVIEAVLYQPVAEHEALPNPKLIAGLAMKKPHAMKMCDFIETRFGIRSVTADAKNGLCINGKRMELTGGSAEQSAGAVCRLDKETFADITECDTGEAGFDLIYGRLKQYREAGQQAICLCGASASDDFFDACNRLGILVFYEAADEAEICRARSFPCVAAWMLPPEPTEWDAARVRQLDSTRPVGGVLDFSDEKAVQSDGRKTFSCAGINGVLDRAAWNDATESICAPWDIVGYPGDEQLLEEAKVLFPNRVIFVVKSG